MKAKTIFVIFILFLFLSCTNQKIEIHGSNYGFLGIVRNNILNIYKFADEWIEMPDRNFTLRSGDQIVYFDASYMVIQKNSVLMFYTFNKEWIESDGSFALPAGYKKVLYDRIEHDIYLIKDNAIKTYKFIGRSWEEIPESNFILPKNRGDIFLFSWLGITSLSVDEKDNLKFYELDENGLSRSIVSFIPPPGYKKIIPYFQSIGVVEKDVIKFYEPSYDKFEDQRWQEITNMDFLLNQ